MATPIYPDYPPDTTKEQHEYLLSNIKDWTILNGLAVRPAHSFVSPDVDPSGSIATAAPVTIFPSLFPRSCFDEARAIQKAYSELYAAIARDRSWLKEIVEDLIEVDNFIANLWKIHLEVEKEGYVQNLSLGLFRSDYMVHKDPSDPASKPTVKQVEFNTIASSFGGLSAKVSKLHAYLNSISAYPPSASPLIKSSCLPPNNSIQSLASGLATTHFAYGPAKSTPAYPLCIVLLVQTTESNIFDQLHLSTAVQTTHGIPTFRLPFSQVLDLTTVSSASHRVLIYHPPHSIETPYEVSLIYFRAGYSPSEYTSPTAWSARLHLERSAAIKCPSILTHLAGSKKIQQELATPDSPHLTRFLSSTSSAPFIERIRATFAAIYPLDSSPAGQTAIAIATSPEKSVNYVLKPQREGGGNNIYGSRIPAFLRSLGDDERKWRAHILMEMITPPTTRNSIFRNGEVKSGEVVGELGVYGVCLWRNGNPNGVGEEAQGEVLENWEAGFLLRTKGRDSDEGGVAAGFGSVDSPCLIDV